MTRQSAGPGAVGIHWAVAFVALTGCSSGERSARPLAGATSTPRHETPATTGPSSVPMIVSQPRPFRLAMITTNAGAAGETSASAPGATTSAATVLDPRRHSSGSRPPDARRVNWDSNWDSTSQSTGESTAHAGVAVPARLTTEEIPADAAAGIRAALAEYLVAFNRHDAAALAAHWTTKGTSVDLASGVLTVGRDAVHEVFAALFAQDESAAIDMEVESIRPVRDDVVLVDGVTRLSFAGEAPASSRFAAVMVREDGQWRLESMREAASGRQVAPEAVRPLDALAWLLGSWEDIGEGVTAGSQCFWSAGRGFIVRTHVVAIDGVPAARPVPGDERIPGLLHAGTGESLELTEIIGWDPRERTIRSWLFTSTGGFAEGTWTRDGSAWAVRLEGRGRDAGRACVCTLAPQGADGLSVSCDSDALAHLLPPACDFVRTARAE